MNLIKIDALQHIARTLFQLKIPAKKEQQRALGQLEELVQFLKIKTKSQDTEAEQPPPVKVNNVIGDYLVYGSINIRISCSDISRILYMMAF